MSFLVLNDKIFSFFAILPPAVPLSYIYHECSFQISTYYQLLLLIILFHHLMVRWYCHTYSSVHQPLLFRVTLPDICQDFFSWCFLHTKVYCFFNFSWVFVSKGNLSVVSICAQSTMFHRVPQIIHEDDV